MTSVRYKMPPCIANIIDPGTGRYILIRPTQSPLGLRTRKFYPNETGRGNELRDISLRNRFLTKVFTQATQRTLTFEPALLILFVVRSTCFEWQRLVDFRDYSPKFAIKRSSKPPEIQTVELYRANLKDLNPVVQVLSPDSKFWSKSLDHMKGSRRKMQRMIKEVVADFKFLIRQQRDKITHELDGINMSTSLSASEESKKAIEQARSIG